MEAESMFVLDTDHMSLLEHPHSQDATRLRARIERVAPDLRVTTIISFEEQTRGWMSYIAKSRTLVKQVEAYRRLRLQLQNYCSIRVFDFDARAAVQFQNHRHIQHKIGNKDLKIAAIVLANDATLLTRNTEDFGLVPGLKFEDWSA
jgi:tRNA(fMet)-specific endonuclease VapC